VSSINKIILVGNVVGEVDDRVTSSGDAYAKFKLKVDRPERTDGIVAQADEIEIVAWRQMAESAKTISNGDSVVVEGRIQTRTTEDEGGRRKYFTEIDAKVIQKLGAPSTASKSSSQPKADVKKQFKELTSTTVETKSVKEVSESDFDFTAPVSRMDDEEVPF
jgi:single-strand DNA-binding protein